ncbi:hypothetical protein DYH09_08795 [bacterium CPR1]|nr:hypothetical protein [bacterium CPR1]
MLAGHLWKALQINLGRLPAYARLTQGRSLPLSCALIGLELSILPLALVVDALARPLNRRGSMVVEEDFVDLELQPFLASYEAPETVQPADLARVADRTRVGTFRELALACEGELEQLGDPRCQCMLRHMLESLLRIANNAPQHARQGDSSWLSWLLIGAHRALLPVAGWLDRLAAPLQKEGVPILFQDLPAVPPRASLPPSELAASPVGTRGS